LGSRGQHGQRKNCQGNNLFHILKSFTFHLSLFNYHFYLRPPPERAAPPPERAAPPPLLKLPPPEERPLLYELVEGVEERTELLKALPEDDELRGVL
jgi:hypothetical protein